MSTVENFKTAHVRFSEALEYISKNEDQLKIEGKWEKVVSNFRVKFEAKLDETWQSLTPDQQKSLAPLYLFLRVAQDKEVRKVLEVFNAKVIGVEDEK
jgi:hypothetical protein